jgi:hypothetical protein
VAVIGIKMPPFLERGHSTIWRGLLFYHNALVDRIKGKPPTKGEVIPVGFEM